MTASLPADFRRFLLAAGISNLGDGIRVGALPLIALQLTDDPRLISLVTAATFLPWVLVGPLAGVLVDRGDRRRLILLAQVGRGAAVLGLAGAVAAGGARTWMVLAAALAVGIGETVVDAAAQAAVPRLVPDDQLERANGLLITAVTLLDEVVGVALGAALFARAASLPLWADSVTFLLGAALLVTVRTPLQAVRTAPVRSVGEDLAEGLSFLWRHRFLRGLATSVSVTNVGLHMGLGVLVVLVVEVLGAAPATYGLVLGAGSIGGVVGSLVAGRLAAAAGVRRVLGVVHVPFAVAMVVQALAPSPAVVAVGLVVATASLVVYKVPSQAVRQRVTPDHLLGRVVTAFRIVGLGGPVLGAPVGGLVASALGVRWAFALGAGVMVLAGLVMRAALRHLDDAAAVGGPDDGRVVVG